MVAALSPIGVADQGTVEVHLLTWVIFVYIDTVADDFIRGVLN